MAESAHQYRKLRQLDAGPDGVLYEAVDLQGEVAADVAAVWWCDLSPLAASTRWAEQSARLRICQLTNHSALRTVLHCDLDLKRPCVVLRPKSALSLADLMATHPRLDVAQAVRMSHELASAVAELHRLGLTHGALCPEKVEVEGFAIHLDSTGLQLSSTPANPIPLTYRSAESATAVDTPADVYALAALVRDLFNSVASATPGAAETALGAGAEWRSTAIRAALLDEFACPPQLARLQQLLRQASVDDPFERPGAEQIAAAMQAILHAPSGADEANAHASLDSTAATCDEPFALPLPLDQTGDESAGVRPVAAAASRVLRPGELLGKYRIAEKLGEGGMGAVYRAEDRGAGTSVALKVLSPAYASRPQSLARFLKEARLLSTINNPYVTNLIEVNHDRGLHYIAMELVEGTNLEAAMTACGPLDEKVALAIVADVARALVDAHEQGIVHRDIKPANVLLACDAQYAQPAGVDDFVQLLQSSQLKLSDFGLARHVEQSESLALTRAGSFLGTPLYAAPEQCAGNGEITPQTDVYALGVVLFELLTGRTPFVADDALKLAALHRFEPAPSVRTLQPQLSEAVARLVAQALAKQPAARHASAGHLLREITQILQGNVAEVATHPLLPQHQPDRLCRADWVWELSASPAQLWPYVSNTERINRAAGVPPVKYETRRDDVLGLRKFGTFRLAGLNIAWEEHPFEWVEGQRMGILREFTQGPFRWFLSTVDLEALPSGGTRLRHGVQIEPRGWLGRLVSFIEVKLKGSRALDRIYRRIDSLVSEQAARTATTDLFEESPALAQQAQSRLAERVRQLVGRGVSTDLAERIGDYLANAPAQELGHIRPIVLAEQLNHDTDQVLAACLQATAVGLLVLRWDILCPTCRVASDVQQTLKAIAQHAHCEACNLDFELDFARSVELLFGVHPEIRQADVGTYCIGGPEHSPHVVAQLRIASQEMLELELELPEGEYLLRGPQLTQQIQVVVRKSAGPSQAAIHFEPTLDARHACVLRSGRQLLSLTNRLPNLLLVRLERTIPRHDVVTAAHASSLALFRELFPDQLLGTENLMSLQSVTLLTTQIADVDGLYQRLGDASACALLRQHFQLLEAQVRREGGAVVKFVGEGMLATFPTSVAGLRAALRLQSAMLAAEATSTLQLRIGLHSGASLVATLNDRLDYLGATPRIASLLPSQARPGELILTQAVSSDPTAAAVLRTSGLPSEADELSLAGAALLPVTRVQLGQAGGF